MMKERGFFMMKTAIRTERPRGSLAALHAKLLSATAMLLVSAIMMVSTSYAWYVLSTAPEVSNIKTQVGANGALEIALLDKDSWGDLSRLDMGDIDESIEGQDVATTAANLTWGNLVNLGDKSYGMDKIVLNPARLYIEPDGNGDGGEAQYKVNELLLKTPVYREDGRIERLDKESTVNYTFSDGAFNVKDGHGVRAIGIASDMGVFELGMNAAQAGIKTYTSSTRTEASRALNDNGSALATIVIDHVLNNKDSFTPTDAANIKKLAQGMQSALAQIETALRYAFAGFITTTQYKDSLTDADYQAALAEITGENALDMNALLTKYSGITTLIPEMGDYITKLAKNQGDVEDAIAKCDEKINGNATISWNEINSIISPLVDTDKMLVAGMTVKDLQDAKNEGGLSALIDPIIKGGLTVTVPSGSGLLSDIADFANDYTAKVVVEHFKYDTWDLNNVEATMVTKTDVSPVYLTDCYNGLKKGTVASSNASNAITDYFGYAIDLAFRTNAADSSLLLQTDPRNRIWEGDTDNASLQGGGSYMSFSTSAGLSATKMVKLMQGIRVVFMDKEKTVLGIAALDCTLGKDVYKKLDAPDSNGKVAYLDIGGEYQKSDLIDQATYDALPEKSSVSVDKVNRQLTAKLYLYDFAMTESKAASAAGTPVTQDETAGAGSTETTTEVKYTGGITMGKEAKKENDAVITALEQDEAKIVTALVYLDGSVVNNSSVAANASYSMTGTLNLQFSSSATLVPADNNALRGDKSVVYTELTNTTYQAGYYFDGTDLYKRKDNVKLYQGSDGKYYASADGETYTELTVESISGVLEAVTATLSGGSGAKAGTAFKLNATLSDETLTVVKYELKYADGTSVGATGSSGEFSVTEENAGDYEYQAVLTVKVGGENNAESQNYTIKTGELSVTVAEATA